MIFVCVPDTFDIVNLSPSTLYTFLVSVANDRGVGDPFVLLHRTPDVEGMGHRLCARITLRVHVSTQPTYLRSIPWFWCVLSNIIFIILPS